MMDVNEASVLVGWLFLTLITSVAIEPVATGTLNFIAAPVIAAVLIATAVGFATPVSTDAGQPGERRE